MICLLFVTVLSFGYAATNLSVSIDDIYGDWYVGDGNVLLRAGRFTSVFWSKLFGYHDKWIYNSFAIDLIALFLFLWAAINYCVLFRRIVQDNLNQAGYIIFSCILVSYPLMNEIWEYTTSNLSVCAGFFCSSVALLIIWEEVHGSFRALRLLFAAGLMMLVSSYYESVALAYICLVFSVLALQSLYGEEKEKEIGEVIRQGSVYAGVLATGIILKSIVHNLLLLILHLPKGGNGETGILWGSKNVLEHIKELAEAILQKYIMNGILYLPIMELCVSVLIFLVLCWLLFWKKKNWGGLLSAFGMLFSLVLLSLFQGLCTPYRACQVFAVFVAFTLMMLVNFLWKLQNRYLKWVYPVAVGICCLLCIRQAVNLNYFLTLNHLRSEEEANVVRSVSLDLQENFDVSKPIVFTGRYELSQELSKAISVPQESWKWKLYAHLYACFLGKSYEQIYTNYYIFWSKIPETNVNSIIAWAADGNRQLREAMPRLFRYYGLSYQVADYDQKGEEATQYVIDNNVPSYPRNGYIVDRGDYIIVNFRDYWE